MTPFDREIAARTIFGEARGETADGKLAVMHVLLNRLAAGRWKTLAAVCMASKQFSCMNDGDPNRIKLFSVSAEDLVDEYVAVDNPGDDLTLGAEYYYAVGIQPPPWVSAMAKTVVIGRHVFYKEAAHGGVTDCPTV